MVAPCHKEIVDTRGKRHARIFNQRLWTNAFFAKAYGLRQPVLREYLIGEAMHALGVPTTRVLAAVTTGDQVIAPPGVISRTSWSPARWHISIFILHVETETVRQFTSRAIARHYPAARRR